jgi:hypothetical protein
MNYNANKLDTLSRRSFMADAAKTFFGVTIGSSMAQLYGYNSSQPGTVANAPGFGKAKSVIYLFLSGGLTHLDTFDPKPEAGTETMGNTKVINGKGDIRLGHHLAGIAKQSDSIAIVRSMSSTQGAHGPGRYFMRTAYPERTSITHPTIGGWVNKVKEKRNQGLPSYVTVNCENGHPGAGFFEPEFQPLPIGDATLGLKNSARPTSVSEKAFQDQLDLRHKLDAEFDSKFHYGYKNVRAYNEMYDAAVRLMKSEDLVAFDLTKEDASMHKLYGESNFGKGCLLARRLVERQVNFVEVELGGFDWHNSNFESADEKLPVVDQGVSALLIDLKQRGLLDSTLVVIATEFGRTPKINENEGRDHFPKAFSCVLAGAGIKGGYIHGKTDETGANVTENKVSAGDFNATIGHAMGIQNDLELFSPSKRPFKMGNKDGKPIYSVFA